MRLNEETHWIAIMHPEEEWAIQANITSYIEDNIIKYDMNKYEQLRENKSPYNRSENMFKTMLLNEYKHKYPTHGNNGSILDWGK